MEEQLYIMHVHNAQSTDRAGYERQGHSQYEIYTFEISNRGDHMHRTDSWTMSKNECENHIKTNQTNPTGEFCAFKYICIGIKLFEEKRLEVG